MFIYDSLTYEAMSKAYADGYQFAINSSQGRQALAALFKMKKASTEIYTKAHASLSATYENQLCSLKKNMYKLLNPEFRNRLQQQEASFQTLTRQIEIAKQDKERMDAHILGCHLKEGDLLFVEERRPEAALPILQASRDEVRNQHAELEGNLTEQQQLAEQTCQELAHAVARRDVLQERLQTTPVSIEHILQEGAFAQDRRDAAMQETTPHEINFANARQRVVELTAQKAAITAQINALNARRTQAQTSIQVSQSGIGATNLTARLYQVDQLNTLKIGLLNRLKAEISFQQHGIEKLKEELNARYTVAKSDDIASLLSQLENNIKPPLVAKQTQIDGLIATLQARKTTINNLIPQINRTMNSGQLENIHQQLDHCTNFNEVDNFVNTERNHYIQATEFLIAEIEKNQERMDELSSEATKAAVTVFSSLLVFMPSAVGEVYSIVSRVQSANSCKTLRDNIDSTEKNIKMIDDLKGKEACLKPILLTAAQKDLSNYTELLTTEEGRAKGLELGILGSAIGIAASAIVLVLGALKWSKNNKANDIEQLIKLRLLAEKERMENLLDTRLS